MRFLRKAVLWIYVVSAFFAFPMLLGMICRGEKPLSVWRDYNISLARHGRQDALLTLYFYGVFYITVFFIPYFVILIWFEPKTDFLAPWKRPRIMFLSLWLVFTLFLFSVPIIEFFRHLPTDTLNGWLLIGWCIWSYYAIRMWLRLKSDRVSRQNREAEESRSAKELHLEGGK